jgi:hypothetical protein
MEPTETLPIHPPNQRPLFPVIITGLLACISVAGWFLNYYGVPLPIDDVAYVLYMLISSIAFVCCILFLGALTQYFGFTKEELNKIGDDSMQGKPPI